MNPTVFETMTGEANASGRRSFCLLSEGSQRAGWCQDDRAPNADVVEVTIDTGIPAENDEGPCMFQWRRPEFDPLRPVVVPPLTRDPGAYSFRIPALLTPEDERHEEIHNPLFGSLSDVPTKAGKGSC